MKIGIPIHILKGIERINALLLSSGVDRKYLLHIEECCGK